jgi:hypothetical protein
MHSKILIIRSNPFNGNTNLCLAILEFLRAAYPYHL